MRLPFSKSSALEETFLTLDVGSHSVKVCVCELQNDSLIHVIGFGECVHTQGDILLGVIRNFNGVVENIKTAVEQAQEMADAKPRQVILGISGEVSHGLTTVVRLHRGDPQVPVSEHELAEMDYRVEEAARIEAQNLLCQEFGQTNISIDIISTSVTNYKIDGRTLHNPLGNVGSTVDIYSYSAYIESTINEKLQKAVKKAGLKIIITTSTLFSYSQALARKDFDNTNSIIIDIGGELTQLAVLIEGGIVSQASFSLGGSSFTRGIMQELNRSFDECELIKYDFNSDNLKGEEKEQIKKAITNVTRLWLSALNLALHDMPSVQCFPSDICLSGGGSNLNQLKEPITLALGDRSLVFDNEIKVKLVECSDLFGIANDLSECPLSMIIPASLAVVAMDIEET